MNLKVTKKMLQAKYLAIYNLYPPLVYNLKIRVSDCYKILLQGFSVMFYQMNLF